MTMAEDEQKNGSHADAWKLTGAIITAQTAEVDKMNEILALLRPHRLRALTRVRARNLAHVPPPGRPARGRRTARLVHRRLHDLGDHLGSDPRLRPVRGGAGGGAQIHRRPPAR
ncbi:DUF305 domain-containing protein [Streptomyces sp. BPTC-684]|uniref:DUF305 domain-containing protein n=1 Tax=Streptomyces sp. BPTC-684 TaxID=3043734 RepID=UPI0024B08317|nr:DUF305 domain-containing protein [Streptomyces sp. BPTC-684]WHM41478.1 DUF305 domain-containing protein [Streptomyces sp. BPTC-684]